MKHINSNSIQMLKQNIQNLSEAQTAQIVEILINARKIPIDSEQQQMIRKHKPLLQLIERKQSLS
jgi:DNA-binding MurR/RpiR family transcriptional regulator